MDYSDLVVNIYYSYLSYGLNVEYPNTDLYIHCVVPNWWCYLNGMEAFGGRF